MFLEKPSQKQFLNVPYANIDVPSNKSLINIINVKN